MANEELRATEKFYNEKMVEASRLIGFALFNLSKGKTDAVRTLLEKADRALSHDQGE